MRLQLAVRAAVDVAEVPRLDRVGARVRRAPGLEHLHEPALDRRRVDADRTGGGVDLGAFATRLRGGERDHAPIRAVDLVAAVEGTPERPERIEDRLALRGIVDDVQQLQRRAAVDLAGAVAQVIAVLDVAAHEGRAQVVVAEFATSGVTALA